MFLLIRMQLVTNAPIVHCAMQNGRVRGTRKTLLSLSCMAVTSISCKSLKNKGVLPVGSLVNSATCSYRSWKPSTNQHLLHSSRVIDVHAPETAHVVTVDRSFISLMQYAFSGAANCPQWELLYGTRMIIYLSIVDGCHNLAYWHCSHSMRHGLCNDTVSLCLSVPSCAAAVCCRGPRGQATSTDCCTARPQQARPPFDPHPQQHGGQQQMRSVSCLQRRRRLCSETETDKSRLDAFQICFVYWT